MSARPIIFSGPMVRALLDGRKTMTRRVLKPQPSAENIVVSDSVMGPRALLVRSRWQPGDLLWVRETWAQSTNHQGPIYRADGESLIRWRPSIHMPRRASRLTLRVTGVKVEMLQDISEADARAEGAQRPWRVCEDDGTSYIDGFGDLWDSLHGPGSWEANPWVAAISFDVIKANIDRVKP